MKNIKMTSAKSSSSWFSRRSGSGSEVTIDLLLEFDIARITAKNNMGISKTRERKRQAVNYKIKKKSIQKKGLCMYANSFKKVCLWRWGEEQQKWREGKVVGGSCAVE